MVQGSGVRVKDPGLLGGDGGEEEEKVEHERERFEREGFLARSLPVKPSHA